MVANWDRSKKEMKDEMRIIGTSFFKEVVKDGALRESDI